MSTRVILVTGANGALGLAIARSFLEESSNNFLWLGVHKNREHTTAFAHQFAGRCGWTELDVTNVESWEAAVGMILATHSRLDVLVNNAGRHHDVLLGMMPKNTWASVLESNLDSVFHGCQAVLRTMIAQHSGRIVNVSSLSAWLAPAGQTNYAAAKAGVLALTQSLAKEVARFGVTVNAVCPGFIESGALSGMSDEEWRATQKRVPMGRFGKPEEVAAAVKFLASAEAAYITGAALKIDGGIL